jgi:4-amino-4-deoxy-L-arabinose transferase-like glycosyltransferase
MTDQPGKPGRESPVWAKVGLLLILLWDVWWRCHTIGPTVRDLTGFAPWPVVIGEAEPLDCDEAAYAYIGRRLNQGAVMYRDVSENKPPLGYWLYTLAVAFGGANELTIRLMPIPYVLATIALVWWLGLRLRGPTTACLAAWLFGLLSTDPYLFGNGANMEHFLNFFAVASLAAMVRSFEVPSRRWLMIAGACVGAGFLVKQVVGLHGLIYAIAVVVNHRGDRDATSFARKMGSKLADLIALAGGFGATLVVVIVVLWLQGAGSAAFDDIVIYGSALTTIKVPGPHSPPKLVRWFAGNADPEGVLPPPFGRTRYLVWWGSGSWPVWIAAVPAVVWLLTGLGAGRTGRLVGAWTLSSWLQVAIPGLFWAHYYLLPTPGLALVVAVATVSAFSAIRGSFRAYQGGRVLAVSVVSVGLIASLGGTAWLQVRDYLMVAPEALTSRFKGGQQWVVLRAMGRELAHRSKAWEHPTLYVWGWQSPLFIYSGLDCPTRHFFADPLLEDYSYGYHRNDPRVRPRVERIMKDLEANPPSMSLIAYAAFPELSRFMNAHDISTRVEAMGASMPLWVDREGFARFQAIGQSYGRRGDRGRLFDQREIAVSEPAHDRGPGLGQGVGSGRFGYLAAEARVVHEAEQGAGHLRRRRGGFDEDAGLTRPDNLADAAGPDRDDRQAGGEGFQDDVAECLGQAREGKEVGRRVVVSEVFARSIADEPGVRSHHGFQVGPGWAIADEQEPDVRPGFADAFEHLGQVHHVLLGREPADVADHHIVRREPERLANLRSTRPVGAEQAPVDPSRPEDQPLEASRLKVADGRHRRDVGLECPVMEPAEIPPGRPFGPAEPVMVAILVEVGVEAGNDRGLAAASMTKSAEAEGHLGRDVDQVGPERVDRPVDSPERRQGDAHLTVKRQGPRLDQVVIGPGRGMAVIRVDDLDRVARLFEMLDQLPERPRNSVDLRGERLGHEGQSHGRHLEERGPF